MTEVIPPALKSEILPREDERTWSPSVRTSKRLKGPKFPPDKDIELWLKHNAPLTFQQLADIRYCLYHRFTRADFTISDKSLEQFTLTGRHSKLRIVNDRARHYLLWKLRLLGRKKKWIGALPRTKKPRKEEQGFDERPKLAPN